MTKPLHFFIIMLVFFSVIVLGFYVRFRYPYFPFEATTEYIPLAETGEMYSVVDVPVLGGDGAKVWEVYRTKTRELIGRAQSGEAFNPQDPTVFAITNDKKGISTAEMYFSPLKKRLSLSAQE